MVELLFISLEVHGFGGPTEKDTCNIGKGRKEQEENLLKLIEALMHSSTVSYCSE